VQRDILDKDSKGIRTKVSKKSTYLRDIVSLASLVNPRKFGLS
jgi:hypothetical protein